MTKLKNCLLCSSLLAIGFLAPSYVHLDSLPGREVTNIELGNVKGMGCTQTMAGTKMYCDAMCGYISLTKLDATGGSSGTKQIKCTAKVNCVDIYIDNSKGCSGG